MTRPIPTEQGASARADQATRASPEPASGLGQKASVPCAFTPGPWKAVEADDRHQEDAIPVKAGKHTVCEVEGWPTDHRPNRTVAEAEADARLIAAAPELYEELAQQADGAATIISLLRGQGGPVAASLVGMLNFQEQSARAALAKARGGQ